MSETFKVSEHIRKRAMKKKKANKITRELTIGDFIEKYPAMIEPLMKYGFHCIGCHVSQYETLEQGLAAHGMSDEEIEMTLTELNKLLESKLKDSSEK